MFELTDLSAQIVVLLAAWHKENTRLYNLNHDNVTGRHHGFVVKLANEFANLGKSVLTILTDEYLGAAGNEFLYVELGITKAPSYKTQTLVEEFDILQGRTVLSNGEPVGVFVDGQSNSLRNTVYFQDRLPGVWYAPVTDLDHPRNGYVKSALFPLTGKSLEHPVFQRQAKYALNLLLGRNILFEGLRKLDRDADKIQKNLAALRDEVKLIALQGINIEELLSQYAELADMMKRHDWTFHYSDMSLPKSWEMERKIHKALGNMSEKDACAIWHHFCPVSDGLSNWDTLTKRELLRKDI